MTPQEQQTLDAQIAEFIAQHPELVEAMRVFEMSNAQYARAIAALTFCPTVTAASTEHVSSKS